jgi:putative spermidine/putrescine transport system substrate-binding protein
MIDLFANGEISFDMAYNPAEASSLVENGRYPTTTRTFVFDTGTIANTHYVAIPYNSPTKRRPWLSPTSYCRPKPN